MAAWRYEISLLVMKKYFTSERSERVKYFSTLEEKFRISARPCNILYLCTHNRCVRWNDLLKEIAVAENLNTFKNRLRCHLANFSGEVLQTCNILYILYLIF